MYNWSTDLKNIDKTTDSFKIWKLEQLINFGLNNEKLDRQLVKKYWPKLYLDPAREKLLKFLLW